MIVFPRSAGTFLMSRSEISLNDAAVSRMAMISSPGTPSSPSRCRCVNAMVPPSALDDDLVHAVRFREVHRDTLAAGGGEVLADVVGTNRELAVAAVDQDGELDRLRAPEVDQCVHRGACGAAGEEHVVDEEDAAALDGEGDVGSLHAGRLQAAVEVVAIERNVDDPERDPRTALDLLQRATQPLPEVHAARADADQGQVLGVTVALDHLVRDPRERPLDGLGVHHLAGAVRAHGRRLRSQGRGAKKKPPRRCREAFGAWLAWSVMDRSLSRIIEDLS